MRLIRWLLNLVCRVVECPVRDINNLELDMRTATMTWVDPVTPFDMVEFAVKVAGADKFTGVGEAGPGVQKLVIPDLVDGDYEFRAVVRKGTRRTNGVVVPVSIVTPVAPLDEVGNFKVTLS